MWSNQVQRGRVDKEPDNTAGLIDQSTTGVPVRDELQDAKQGMDPDTREQYAQEAKRDFGRENGGPNPYEEHAYSRRGAEDSLASQYAEARGRDYEGGTSMNKP